MDGELICNFKKCRKKLTSLAWVTSCSHIFCNEDGSREFEKKNNCPACGSILPETLDIIQVNLNPSEQYKSMILAGQKPEILLEICTRATSFWTYQIHQEMLYQESSNNKCKEKLRKQQQCYEQALEKAKGELKSIKHQFDSSQKELEQSKRKIEEISEKLIERHRQFQKLQMQYEVLKRKLLVPGYLEKENETIEPPLKMKPNYNFITDLRHQTFAEKMQKAMIENQLSKPENFVLLQTPGSASGKEKRFLNVNKLI